MRRRPSVLIWLCLWLPLAGGAGHAGAGEPKQTVCTITVNSDDEGEAFRRNLPPERFEFVELVERGRPDWLASACRKKVQCDVLLISGHFDDGSEFYSDRLDSHDHLPVAEMERASCTDGCSGLFSRLKEVYLFGCNTLNADPLRYASGEAVRSLVRAGHSPADAEALARVLEARHGESNRDRMRVVFKDAPVIYGFSSKAPLGARAGPLLERYFKAGGGAEVGQGRSSAALLSLFGQVSMRSAPGVTVTDVHAGHREDVCRFVDDAPAPVERVRFVHALMKRDMAEVQLHLDRLDTLTAALARTPAFDESADAMATLASDSNARSRYLAVARDADSLATAGRMLRIARRIGWLTDDGERMELVGLVDARARRSAISAADIDTVCTSNARNELEHAAATLDAQPAYSDTVANAAALACLGRGERRARALRGLTADDERDALVAQVYLRHHPLHDADELRSVTMAIARMSSEASQVRALDTIAAMRIADRESLATLALLFPRTKSIEVQRAIAGVLIRADYQAITPPELARALRLSRIKSADGEDIVDALIRRLQAAS
ncbi:MAG: hypothetical protein ABW054_11100 [Casimicrobiaceae bacterium]